MEMESSEMAAVKKAMDYRLFGPKSSLADPDYMTMFEAWAIIYDDRVEKESAVWFHLVKTLRKLVYENRANREWVTSKAKRHPMNLTNNETYSASIGNIIAHLITKDAEYYQNKTRTKTEAAAKKNKDSETKQKEDEENEVEFEDGDNKTEEFEGDNDTPGFGNGLDEVPLDEVPLDDGFDSDLIIVDENHNPVKIDEFGCIIEEDDKLRKGEKDIPKAAMDERYEDAESDEEGGTSTDSDSAPRGLSKSAKKDGSGVQTSSSSSEDGTSGTSSTSSSESDSASDSTSTSDERPSRKLRGRGKNTRRIIPTTLNRRRIQPPRGNKSNQGGPRRSSGSHGRGSGRGRGRGKGRVTAAGMGANRGRQSNGRQRRRGGFGLGKPAKRRGGAATSSRSNPISAPHSAPSPPSSPQPIHISSALPHTPSSPQPIHIPSASPHTPSTPTKSRSTTRRRRPRDHISKTPSPGPSFESLSVLKNALYTPTTSAKVTLKMPEESPRKRHKDGASKTAEEKQNDNVCSMCEDTIYIICFACTNLYDNI